MKRTPLKRKTPLKRTGRLRQVSTKQRERNAKVRARFKELTGCDPLCERCHKAEATDPHHPRGRRGGFLLFIYPVCRPCHDWIHSNPTSATKEGMLYKNR